ncbi:MAG TPA: NIPSNAP family protein [Terriglobia bacterium]|nr:NIPSNAP family protein [Terriglobia bacterium]
MQRRKFMAASLAASALAAGKSGAALAATGQAPGNPGAGQDQSAREYYQLRRYELRSGPQVKLVNGYFQDAFIPAANRLGIRPVGVFNVTAGDRSPSLYALIPCPSLETLVHLDARLGADSEYAKAAAGYLEAPAAEPAYERMESSLMIAFEGWPKLQTPAATATHGPRAFELRTYESPSDRDHVRKVEMFNSGEFEVFHHAGFQSVFYGDTLIGSRLPNLTYMLAFDDLASRNRLWAAFGASPDWKKLSGDARYAFEEIVSNITNVILSPAAYSQI